MTTKEAKAANSSEEHSANHIPLKPSESPRVHFVRTFVQTNSSGFESLGEGLASIRIGQQSIEDAITGFSESVKIGMKVMDELSKIHPFIAGPLLAFKLVISLDMKRRNNDMKIVAVKAHMQDLVCVIVEVFEIAKTRSEGPVGVALRLKDLLEQIETDITTCSSECDIYLEKTFLRKFIKSPVYEARFAEYAARFIGHQDVNRKLDDQRVLLEDIQTQFKIFLKVLDTPKEREVRKIIDEAGGAGACLDDEKILRELILKSEDNSFHKNKKGVPFKGFSRVEAETTRGKDNEITIKEVQNTLRQELYEDLDKALEKNFKLFTGKLLVQKNEINDAMERQGDRIISYFSGGHERIINPHIQNIWREMGWRGSIKAVNFVFALRDYFSSFIENPPESSMPTQLPSPPLTSMTESFTVKFTASSGDEWTKKYISVSHLQPIMESFDDDGSGFINIQEVNRFTQDCPTGWSLAQWIAYWAAGWHISISQYKFKIYRAIRKMFELLCKIRPDNRILFHCYLQHNSILKLEALLRSTKHCDEVTDDPELMKLVRTTMEQDEIRLKKNLEPIRYKLDSPTTVRLVCGTGRIDKHVFPLLDSVLKHHLKIFQLARTHILHFDELDWCTNSLASIMTVCEARHSDLKATFRQMYLNPERQFENFAFGMFKECLSEIRIENNTIHSVLERLTLDPNEDEDVQNLPQDLDKSILELGPQDRYYLKASEQLDIFEQSGERENHIYGKWAGFCHIAAGDSARETQGGLFRLKFNDITTGNSTTIAGHAESYLGSMDIAGVYTGADTGDSMVDLVMTYEYGFWIRCRGRVNPQFTSIAGHWFAEADESGMKPKPGGPISVAPKGTFTFTRTPADAVRFRYSEASFLASPTRARWQFLRDAVLYDIQRKWMTKNFVFTRLHQVLQFKNLLIKRFIDNNEFSSKGRSEYNESEVQELVDLEMNIPPSIDQFYFSLALFIVGRLPRHAWYCDNCGQTLIQARIACITCRHANLSDGIDLCLGCKDTENILKYEDIIHDSSHSTIFTEWHFHNSHAAWMIPKAREVSKRIKSVFRRAEMTRKEKLLITNGDEVADEGASESEDLSLDSGMKCSDCKKPVTLPCWVYLLYKEDCFICDPCGSKKLIPPVPHKIVPTPPAVNHIMLRINNSAEVKVVEKDRLVRVESRLEVVKSEIDVRFGQLEENVIWRTRALETKFDAHLTGMAQARSIMHDSLPNTSETEVDANVEGQPGILEHRIEQRLSAMELALSGLDRKIEELLTALLSRG
ncbi:hypothetical protein BDQ17DRAFT_1429337 [Cyathus striatus]|nr:hypothetical protein BDQ17DRAFT_1429337 [Cyathus striatus]